MVEELGKNLMGHTLKEYSDALAGRTPAPGGSSTAALAGAYAAALGIMAARLTYGTKAWEAVDFTLQEGFRDAEEALELLKSSLEKQVDADENAFNIYLETKKMSKETAELKESRKTAMAVAAVRILTVPLNSAEQCLAILQHLQTMATCGDKKVLPDIGAGASLALAGLEGSLLNVRINLPGIPDGDQRKKLLEQAERMWERGCEIKEEIMTAIFIRMAT